MNDLVVIEKLNPVHVFVDNGLDPVIEQIEKEARSIVLDISSEEGRSQIKSLAHKIARSKTALDKVGKDLVSGWKEQAKKVDVERARAWDRLESLQKEIRAPLTEWEDKEKSRIDRHKADLAEIAEGGRFTRDNWETLSVGVMSERLKKIETAAEADWQEFSALAKQEIESATALIRLAIHKRETHDKEQAELARLRQEEADRKQREHEDRLRAEAAAVAKTEAERKAKEEADALAAQVKAEQDAAAAREEAAKRETAEAQERARKAEEARIAAEEKAKADLKAAEEKAAADALAAAEKAKRDAEEAAQRERERMAAELRQRDDDAARREADKKHRAKVNNEAKAAILKVAAILDAEERAKAIVEAIAKGLVPHVKISY